MYLVDYYLIKYLPELIMLKLRNILLLKNTII